MKDATILDARAIEEFQVSHIPGAKWIGDGKPDAAILAKIPKDKPVVIYCSIGYRSEKMGERLKKSGFSKVYNLYGSIFEWANENLPLKNASGAPTKEVHVYNKSWGKWMENKDYTKIY
jgi:rhodanese-related sulfurtransferase